MRRIYSIYSPPFVVCCLLFVVCCLLFAVCRSASFPYYVPIVIMTDKCFTPGTVFLGILRTAVLVTHTPLILDTLWKVPSHPITEIGPDQICFWHETIDHVLPSQMKGRHVGIDCVQSRTEPVHAKVQTKALWVGMVQVLMETLPMWTRKDLKERFDVFDTT